MISSLALLGVMTVGLLQMAMFFAPTDTYVLNGRIHPHGGRVSGPALERALTDVLEADGGTVSRVHCKDSSLVREGLTVMCDATIDDVRWIETVSFKDNRGRFSLAGS